MSSLSDEDLERIYWRRIHTRLLRHQSKILSKIADPGLIRVGVEGKSPPPVDPNPRGLVAMMASNDLTGSGGIDVSGPGPWKPSTPDFEKTVGKSKLYCVMENDILLVSLAGSEGASIRVLVAIGGHPLAPVTLTGRETYLRKPMSREGVVSVEVLRNEEDDGAPFDFALCTEADLDYLG